MRETQTEKDIVDSLDVLPDQNIEPIALHAHELGRKALREGRPLDPGIPLALFMGFGRENDISLVNSWISGWCEESLIYPSDPKIDTKEMSMLTGKSLSTLYHQMESHELPWDFYQVTPTKRVSKRSDVLAWLEVVRIPASGDEPDKNQ